MLSDLTAEYWDNRYSNNDFGWDIGDASAPLKHYFLQLKNKKELILIPGAGNAYEAEFLFKQGFKNVHVLDFAETPLRGIKNRCPGFPDTQLLQMDFFECDGQYDLIIEQTFFCALHPELRKKYVDQTKRLLKPGGKLVGLLFNDPMNSNQPPFGGSESEYRNLFSSSFDIRMMEPCYNSIKPRLGKELFVIMQAKASV